MHGSADFDPLSTTDEVVCGTSPNSMGRLRAFQLALRAAKLTRSHREIVTYVAAHCDRDGTTYVSLKRVAADFGFKQRSTVWEAVEAARVAGFVERVTGGDRDLWIIPLMRGPRTAQGARSQNRAPSEETVSNKRRAPEWEVPELSPDTQAQLEQLHRQLRQRVGRER